MFSQLRSVLIGFLVLLFLIALVPFVDGYFLKQNYYNFISALSADSGVTIKILDYRLGWLSSTAKLSISEPVKINPTGGVATKYPNLPTSASLNMTVDQTIAHGPYVFDPQQNQRVLAMGIVYSNFYFPTQLKAMFVNNQNHQSDVQVRTLMTFDQHYTSHVTTSSFTLMPFPGIPQIIWDGMQGDFTLIVENNRVVKSQVNYTLNGISAKSPMVNVSIQPITYQHVMTRGEAGLWNGTSSLIFPGLNVGSADAPLFNLSGLQMKSTFGSDASHTYNMQMQIGFEHLTTQYVTLNPSTLNFTISHLNPAGLAAISQQLAAQPANNPDIFLQALTPASIVTTNIALHTADGSVLANGQVNWPATIANAQTAEAFATNTNLKLNLRVSVNLFNALVDTYFKSVTPAEKPIDLSQPSEETMLALIDSWSKQQQIPLDISLQLKDLVKSHFASDVFAKNVEQYVVRKEMPQAAADQLKTMYQQVHPVTSATAPKTLPGSVQPAAALPPKPATPADMVKQRMTDLVTHGFFKLDNGDYVTDLTIEQGVVKLNGQVVPKDLVSEAP